MSGRPAPEPRSAYKHYQAITTRWMDNDVYRHVNNVVYYSYFDTVVNQYLIEQGALDIEKSEVVGLVVETHVPVLLARSRFPRRSTPGCASQASAIRASATRSACSATTTRLRPPRAISSMSTWTA